MSCTCTLLRCDIFQFLTQCAVTSFQLVLETKSFNTWSERGKYLLHGDGRTIWFDKSFNMVVFADGRMGLNAEHSFGDAPVIGHAFEFALTQE